MKIIPVIDLLNGTVVHAKKGMRSNYQAIQSSLTHSSKPLDIVAALLDYYPFQQLYIADLNAIQKLGDASQNLQVIETILQHYPDLKIWLDAGISHPNELSAWQRRNFNVILSSENASDLHSFLEIRKHAPSDFVLSLDFMPGGYQGPAELLSDNSYWAKDIILMSLAHVGANQGPNFGLLEEFKRYTDSYNFYAAGGIRGKEDLHALKLAGAHGALIASALHQKLLPHSELALLAQ